MDFEWDEAKNAANIAKHGIDFTGQRRFSRVTCWNLRMLGEIMEKREL